MDGVWNMFLKLVVWRDSDAPYEKKKIGLAEQLSNHMPLLSEQTLKKNKVTYIQMFTAIHLSQWGLSSLAQLTDDLRSVCGDWLKHLSFEPQIRTADSASGNSKSNFCWFFSVAECFTRSNQKRAYVERVNSFSIPWMHYVWIVVSSIIVTSTFEVSVTCVKAIMKYSAY